MTNVENMRVETHIWCISNRKIDKKRTIAVLIDLVDHHRKFIFRGVDAKRSHQRCQSVFKLKIWNDDILNNMCNCGKSLESFQNVEFWHLISRNLIELK